MYGDSLTIPSNIVKPAELGAGSSTPALKPAIEESTFHPFGPDGLTFDDFLDLINPLQHIPIISTLYRELTGDTIAPVPRILGGTLIGGPIGGGIAVVNVLVEEETGKDIGAHVYAGIMGDDEPTGDDGTIPAFDVAANGQETAPLAPRDRERTSSWADGVLEGFELAEQVADGGSPAAPTQGALPAGELAGDLWHTPVIAALREAERAADAVAAIDRPARPPGETENASTPASPDLGPISRGPSAGPVAETTLAALIQYQEWDPVEAPRN